MTDQPSREPSRVRITLESRANGRRIVQHAKGDRYAKGGHTYIRYPETDPEYGRTTTTMKLEPNAVKLIRHGDVRMDQTFVRGERRIGYYETAQGKLELEVRTTRLEHRLSGGTGSVVWSYELEVGGEPAGTFTVKLTIQEEQRI